MANLWSLLRKGQQKTEERFTLDDYASMLQSSPLPVGFMNRNIGSAYEDPDEEFQTYIYQAFKSDGIVFACIVARQLLFSEARFQFQNLNKGRPGDLFEEGHKLDLLETPWPNGTTGELLSRAIQDVDLAGNHYVLREGDRLRRLRPDWVKIILTEAPDDALKSDVAGYMYMPGGPGGDPKKWTVYPVEQVAHWTPIPDPDAQYKGMSWITPVIREIFADKQATVHKGKFFENACTPNLAVSLKEDVPLDQFKEFMEVMNSTKGGVEHAYETLYLGGGADVTVVGADLKQMNFKDTQGAGETRIAAAARVPAIVLGISEGLSGSSLNEGNYNSAKKQFGDLTLRPLWRSISAAYSTLVDVPDGTRLWYDVRDIEFLRADRLDVASIQSTQARTMAALIQSGYEPDSIVEALAEEDWRKLKHSGLYSVQLQPPGTEAAPPDGSTPPVKPTPGGPKSKDGPLVPAKVSTTPPKKQLKPATASDESDSETRTPKGTAPSRGMYDESKHPRDKHGRWTLLGILGELLDEESDHDSGKFPEVDPYESWDSLEHNSVPLTSSNTTLHRDTTSPSSKLVGHSGYEAMIEYVAYDRDTLSINEKLRTGGELSTEEKSRNAALDGVGNATRLTKPTDMWRASVLDSGTVSKMEPGATVSDAGYASTSPYKEIAEYYGKARDTSEAGKEVIMFHIKGQEGDHVIPVRNNEWALPRDTKLVVTGRHDNVVEVEYA